MEESTPSETTRPVTKSSSDGSPVNIVIVAPVSTAGTLLVFITIAVPLIVLLKRHCKLQ